MDNNEKQRVCAILSVELCFNQTIRNPSATFRHQTKTNVRPSAPCCLPLLGFVCFVSLALL